MSWNDFFSSQLFGVIIGALMTGGFTWLLDRLRYKRERKAQIQQKREDIYTQALEVLQEYEISTKQVDNTSKRVAMQKIELLRSKIAVFASKSVSDKYYKIIKTIKPFTDSVQTLSKITELQSIMRTELGIKDV